MYDQHTKTQFIELRAQGRSLARIALDLDIKTLEYLLTHNSMFGLKWCGER